MHQAAVGEVPERLEGVHPDLTKEDKCQGLTPKKKVCQKDIFSLSFYYTEKLLYSTTCSRFLQTPQNIETSSGQTQLLRFSLTLFKDKTFFLFVLRCHYLSLTSELLK